MGVSHWQYNDITLLLSTGYTVLVTQYSLGLFFNIRPIGAPRASVAVKFNFFHIKLSERLFVDVNGKLLAFANIHRSLREFSDGIWKFGWQLNCERNLFFCLLVQLNKFIGFESVKAAPYRFWVKRWYKGPYITITM